MKKRLITSIESAIVHSASTDRDVTVEEITKWHKAHKWATIGYHFVIRRKCLEFGRPLQYVGSHALGYNTGSVGICLVGHKRFTKWQLQCLKKVLAMCEVVVGRKLLVYPHREFDKKGKECPVFNDKDYKRVTGKKLFTLDRKLYKVSTVYQIV